MRSIWDDLDNSGPFGSRFFISDADATTIGIGFFLAVIVAIIVYFTFLSRKNENHFKGFTGWLYEALNFRKLIVEALLKITYMFFAIFLTIVSFVLMTHDFWGGLVCLILYNVLTRVCYEFLLITVMICKNVSEINRKMKNQNNENGSNNSGNTYNMPPQQPYGQQYGQPMMNQHTSNQYQNQYNQRQSAPMNQMQGNAPMNQATPVQPMQNVNQAQNANTAPFNPVQNVQTSSYTINQESVKPIDTQENPIPMVQNTRSCPKCGTMLEKDDAFCPTCGNDVRNL